MRVSSVVFSKSNFLGCLSLLLACAAGVSSSSHAWGIVNKFATPIYEKVISATGANVSVDFIYPEVGFTNDYTITAMFAYDMQNEAPNGRDSSDESRAIVLDGGIGYNYTVLRFHSATENSRNLTASRGMNFSITIFGLDL